MVTDWESLDDSQLIAAYLDRNEQRAISVLVHRYHARIYNRVGRLLRSYKNGAMEADDLNQTVWKNVISNLVKYENQGEKFINWVYTIARNVVIDWARKNGRTVQTVTATMTDDNGDEYDLHELAASTIDPQQEIGFREQIDLMVAAIPALPVHQRMIFLLRFESNLWEQAQPLLWSQLAQLNGISVELAWDRFISARDALVQGKKLAEIDAEEVLIFLVWTQANRPDKSRNITMGYFAKLLGESENTLTTRYHAAVKALGDQLTVDAG